MSILYGQLNPQPANSNVPSGTTAPLAYLSAEDGAARLLQRFGLTATLFEGLMIAASMAADEEGPFYGVKVNMEGDREWPRSFKFGWPNIVMVPDAMLLTEIKPGAFYLNYEGVVPDQVLDWVVLEAYRYSTQPFDKEVASESVTGASVHYMQWSASKGEVPPVLDRLQATLLSPFQMRQLRQSPWPYFTET